MDIPRLTSPTNTYSGTYKKTSDAKNSAVNKAKNTDRAEFSSAAKSADTDSERILPERYNEKSMAGKMYYQGKTVTAYELLETAVKTGAITLDETKTTWYNHSEAMKALVYSKASPAFSWSSTLYSEDRMYVFRVENGQITGGHRAWFDDGTTFFDVAEEIASGKMLCDIDPCKLDEFRRGDPELFEAAYKMGSAKRHYEQTEECYRNGSITKKEYLHDMLPLFLLLFGRNGDVNNKAQLDEVRKYFSRNDFAANALTNYNKHNQSLFDELISQKGYHTYSGLY